MSDDRGSVEDASDKTTQGESLDHEWPIPTEKLRRKLAVPSQGRLYYVRYALKMGWTIEQIHELTNIDPWFLAQMKELVDFEAEFFAFGQDGSGKMVHLEKSGPTERDPRVPALLRKAKELGYSDVQIAASFGGTNTSGNAYRRLRKFYGIEPVYKIVDTCAAEFEAATPYYYSTYETPYTVIAPAVPTGGAPVTSLVENKESRRPVTEDEIRLTDKPKVIIIGGGPNRIGQGIEFDYCCVHAAFAMKELGFESVMINSNPETVSTDYNTSDLLFFEPLTHEDILNICERLNGGPFGKAVVSGQLPVASEGSEGKSRGGASSAPAGSSQLATGNLVKGVIVQFGGQTPLNLARGLQEAGVPIIGTSVDSIDAAGDREQFRQLLQTLGLKQPANGIARSVAEARAIAKQIGYPVLVRPSFVLGGRAMEIVSDENQLNYYMTHAVEAAGDSPILVDKFLDNATECDVDCLADFAADGAAGRAIIIGVMEHIEEAGIHSGDSACALPPYSLSKEIVAKLKEQTKALARALGVRGLMNVQYAIKDGEIYVIEVNPRASRTVPFVGKATGVPWAKIAAKVMAGKTLDELRRHEMPDPKHTSVKESVFPFSKFPGVDVILGPEMRSTGEVMGIDATFPMAFAKSQLAAGTVLPTKGTIYISVRDDDKADVVPVARMLSDCGFTLIATSGTHRVLAANDVPATRISKLAEGRPNIKDYIKNNGVQLIVNTPTKKGRRRTRGRSGRWRC
jgi:carbamoyl-phosphate synthase large subunit